MKESEILGALNDRLDGGWTELETLHGGFVNLVWRLHGGNEKAVVKHAPPYVASLPDIPLSPTRLRFKGLCLNHFGVALVM